MRSLSRTVIAVTLLGVSCTSVRVVQRDGCWVKKTEGALGGGSEELGFCSRPAQPPAEDRLTRLVQECLAQADHRWENQALAAWNHNRPIPPQADDDMLVKTCMSHVSTVLGLEAENASLKARLADLGQDRQALMTATDRDRQFLQSNSDKMVTALGDAAKKPAPAATATATVKSETEVKSPQQAAPSTVVGFAPAPAPVIVNPAASPPPQIAPVEVPIIQAPARPPPKPSSSAICPSKKMVKKLASDGTVKEVPACEVTPKPFPG